MSRTFHGRDVFAPSAAHLARGAKPESFGEVIYDYVQLGLMKPQRMARRAWMGAVIKVDRFGNLITNLRAADFPDLGKRPIEVSVGLQRIYTFARTFGEVAHGEFCVYVGSSGYVEVAVNQGSAAKLLGCGAGAPVELTFFGRAEEGG